MGMVALRMRWWLTVEEEGLRRRLRNPDRFFVVHPACVCAILAASRLAIFSKIDDVLAADGVAPAANGHCLCEVVLLPGEVTEVRVEPTRRRQEA